MSLCRPWCYFLRAARMLSTRLGYGRPAALAVVLAEDLAFELSFLGSSRDFGRALSQIGFLACIRVHSLTRLDLRFIWIFCLGQFEPAFVFKENDRLGESVHVIVVFGNRKFVELF